MEPLVLLSRALDTSKKLGARAAEGLLEESSSIQMALERGGLQGPTHQDDAWLELRVYMPGGRTGQVRVSAPRAADLADKVEDALSRAIASSSASVEDPSAGPADRYDLDERGLGLLDRRHSSLTMADRKTLLQENLAACTSASPRVATDRVTYGETTRTRAFSSTRGVAALEHSTAYEARCVARLKDKPRVYTETVASRQFANVASIPFGMDLGRRMALLDQPARLPSCPQPIFLNPPVMAHLLQELAGAFVASTVREGRSFVQRFLGRPCFSTRLHVIDDPGLPGALHTRAFDDRGVLPSPVVVIKEGQANGLFVDLDTARVAGTRPTGHTLGGRTGPSNLVLRSGNRSRNAIGMDLGQYLAVENLHEFHPIDLATGEVSTLCDLVVFENNEPTGTVVGVPLRLPVRRLLAGIREIAGDQGRFGHVDACSVLLDPLPDLWS